MPLTPIFDLDGTLVDSDAALMAPFASLGVDPDRVPPLGLPLGQACELAGITVEAYLEIYDSSASLAFAGVDDLLSGLDRWAVCSNKARASGDAELARFGWNPELTMFSEDFGGGPKRLEPVLEALRLHPDDAVFTGDTAHDRRCAAQAGVTFVLAGWNARVEPEPGDIVLAHPKELLELLDRPRP